MNDMPTRKRNAKVDKCIFCKSDATVTAEHILSRRFHGIIRQTEKSFRVLRSVEFPTYSEYEQGKFNSDPRHWKIKCVCEKNCNNEWMRRLEERLDLILVSLFTGKEMRIAPSDLADIATWAVMKAIIIDHIDPEDSTTHHMQRYAVYNNQRPPKNGWAVWLGHYPRKTCELLIRSAPFLSLPKTALAKRKTRLATYYNGAIISYVVGELFVQVVHGPKPLGINKWTFPILPDGGSLRRIWPPSSFDVVWPPSAMSNRDLEVALNLFRDRIAQPMRAMG
jgi:hypothetical protein